MCSELKESELQIGRDEMITDKEGWMSEFTCGHKPWMGIRCEECQPMKATTATYKMPGPYAPIEGTGIPCPSCATFRAKLDREKLGQAVYEAWRKAGRELSEHERLDAIIAYLKEG